MPQLFPAIYIVKAIKLDGTVISERLPVTNVSFTRNLALPGRQTLGTWSCTLIPARDVQAHHLIVYKQLDYMQRVEIYENHTLGQPVFSGQIFDLPTNLAGGGTISGSEWLVRLTQRKLRHFEFIGGEAERTFDAYGNVTVTNNISDQLEYLTKPWQTTYRDNFNLPAPPNGVDASWTQEVGTWITELLEGQNRLKGSTVGTNVIKRDLGLTNEQAQSYRVYVEMLAGAKGTAWESNLFFYRNSTGSQVTIQIVHVADDEFSTVTIRFQGANAEERQAGNWEIPFGEWFSLDVWSYEDPNDATQRYYEVYLNDRQFIVAAIAQNPIGGNIGLRSTEVAYFDNFIVWVPEADLIATIASTTITDDREYPGDTYLQAISALCDMTDLEWRTTAGKGKGFDQIEIAAIVGTDVSADVVFEEGKNLVSLQLNPSNKDLVTYLRFKGQGQERFQRLAAAFDFPAWDLYGIVEDDISDNRISNNDLARRKVENELVRRKDGLASLSASVYDGPTTTGAWAIGDEVWVKSIEPDIDKKVRVVSVEYNSGDPIRKVTFDSFPRSRSGNIGVLMDDVGKINRGTKGNSAKITLSKEFADWWIDDSDPRIKLVSAVTLGDPGDLPPSHDWFPLNSTNGTTFQTVPPVLLQAILRECWNMSLSFTSRVGNYAQFGFYGRSFAVFGKSGANLVSGEDKFFRVTIDEGTATELVFDREQNHGITSQLEGNRFKIFEIEDDPGLKEGYHTVKMERAGEENLNIYISLDAVMIRSIYWPLFVEGRAVSKADLTWDHNKDGKAVGNRSIIELYINGVKRTLDLGGPWYGAVSFENRLNLLPYISAPGRHTIEFVLDEENKSSVGEQMTADEEESQVVDAFLDLEVLL